MRQTIRLEVVPFASKWNITERGIGRLSTHPTMAAAKEAARAIANLHTPSQLIIRNEKGEIEEEINYAKRPNPSP